MSETTLIIEEPALQCIYVAAPREGQLIHTPYGPVKSNKHGEWLPKPVIDFLLASPIKLYRVDPDDLTGTPMLSFAPPPNMNDIHAVESARPVGYVGDVQAQARMSEATVAARQNAVVASTPPQRREALVMMESASPSEDAPIGTTGKTRGR